MGMTVGSRWYSVSRPTSVCNTSVRFEGLSGIGLLLGNKLPQACDLPDFFVDEHFFLFVTVDCEPS